MKKWKSMMAVVLAMSLIFCMAACGGENSGDGGNDTDQSAEKVVLHMGSTVSTKLPIYKAMQEFADELNERSDGTMEMVLDIASVHGGDREIVEAVMNGSLAMSYNADIGVAAAIPEIGYVNLPYLFPNRETVEEIYYNGWIGEAYKETLKENGLEVLGTMMESDFRWMTNSKHPIEGPSDLNGLKIRVPENPMYLAFFQKIGAQPTAMSITEVAAALQQKVIDGQDNGPILTYSNGFYEFQPYLLRSNHAYAAASWIMSSKVMDTLTPEQQDLLRELGQKYSEIGQKYMLDAIEGFEKEMEDAGVQIIDVSPELDKLFKEKAHEIWADDSVTKNFDQDAVKRIREEMM